MHWIAETFESVFRRFLARNGELNKKLNWFGFIFVSQAQVHNTLDFVMP